MKLQKDARVLTPEGQEIGKLSRFVLDPRTKNVTNLVFRHGLLSPDEYIIPMRLVDHIDQTGIHLQELPVEQLEDLPKFLQEEFVIADENAFLDETSETGGAVVDSYYYYPSIPMQAGGALYPYDLFSPYATRGHTFSEQVGVPITGARDEEPPIIHRTEENIPEGTVSLKEGSKVYSSDGKHVGNIERVYLDSDSGQATHLVISKGILLKERKQIPVNWIDKIQENEVYLAVDAPFTGRLPDFKEK